MRNPLAGYKHTDPRHLSYGQSADSTLLNKKIPNLAEGGEIDDKPRAFNPEGKDYDYESAVNAGLAPDETGHWSSREPSSGLILKGRGHETFDKTLKGEEEAGYKIEKKGERYYSHPKDNQTKEN